VDNVILNGYSSLMEKATITDIKNRLSAYLHKVKHGEVVLITERGRPVARLETVLPSRGSADLEERLGRLERAGLVRRARKEAKNAVKTMPVVPAGKSSLLQAMLSERNGNR
jgi:prevent-host-death family protein